MHLLDFTAFLHSAADVAEANKNLDFESKLKHKSILQKQCNAFIQYLLHIAQGYVVPIVLSVN